VEENIYNNSIAEYRIIKKLFVPYQFEDHNPLFSGLYCCDKRSASFYLFFFSKTLIRPILELSFCISKGKRQREREILRSWSMPQCHCEEPEKFEICRAD
jgi:hypothetical protein